MLAPFDFVGPLVVQFTLPEAIKPGKTKFHAPRLFSEPSFNISEGVKGIVIVCLDVLVQYLPYYLIA